MYRTQNGIAINNNYIYNISINELRYVDCHYDCAAQLYFLKFFPARSPEFTSDAEIFLLVVLAFGEYGYFYLPNYPISNFQQREPIPAKFSTTLLMSHFNGNNCRNLALKPKIFLVQV